MCTIYCSAWNCWFLRMAKHIAVHVPLTYQLLESVARNETIASASDDSVVKIWRWSYYLCSLV